MLILPVLLISLQAVLRAMLLAWYLTVVANMAMINAPLWTGQESIAPQAESDLVAEAAAADK